MPEADEVVFGPAPPVFPAGAEMAVIQGDPSAAGEVFNVRLRAPDSYVLPAHWHPTDACLPSSPARSHRLGDAFDEGKAAAASVPATSSSPRPTPTTSPPLVARPKSKSTLSGRSS